MTHYVIKIPSRTVVGDITVLPTTFEERSAAVRHAREKTVRRANVSTRIDDTLYIYCTYVVVEAESEEQALKQAKANPEFIALRQSSPMTTYVDEN